MKFLILHKERRGELALWWRPERRGYTVNIDQAGRYSAQEAESIARIRGEDFPVPEIAIGTALVARRVISVEDDANFDNLKAFQMAKLDGEAHERAWTQHVSGSREYHNKCACGAMWPCAYAQSGAA